MRVLGVDPGTVITGWGVIDSSGGDLRHVASGTIRAGRGDLCARLGLIYEKLRAVAEEHQPDCGSLERNFLARNVQSAFRLGEARGVVMAAVAVSRIPLAEYTPATVKKAVTGHGAAGKQSIEQAIRRLLSISERLAVDEADALAVAACHAFKFRFESRLATASRGQPKRPGTAVAIRSRVLG